LNFFCRRGTFPRRVRLAWPTKSEEADSGNKGTIMKTLAIALGAATLLLAGCGQNEQAFVDNLVRQAVTNTGEAQEVAMTRQADNSFSGTATVRRRADGQTVRFNCTARRQGETTQYLANCLQAVDQLMVDTMKTEIRRGLTANGAEVLNIELSVQDQNRMAGFADVRAGGETIRARCEATRESADSPAFRWACNPPEEGAAAPPAGEPAPAQ
jgi:hypothetical protein